MKQVENNIESQQRQYALEARAVQLGWSTSLVEIIDEDQGRSAAQSDKRLGFQRLVTSVGLGEVGIILGLEVSRLARNNRDWYGLLDLCAIFRTLIADADGVYDPAEFNDRLLLGLKGTMSEAELHVLRGRLTAGARNKARRGELHLSLPVGYQLAEDRTIEKTPDESVQVVIARIFDAFREHGSIFQVVQAFRHGDVLIPKKVDAHGRREVRWVPVDYPSVRRVLENPCYAGAYAFGKTTSKSVFTEAGEIRKREGVKLPPEKWAVFITDHHPAYITWRDHEHNQRRIRANRRGFGNPGPVRSGRALLAGLVRCGVCGHSMVTGYGGANGQSPNFQCLGGRMGGERRNCQGFGAARLEASVVKMVLSVLEPHAVEAAILALDDFESSRSRQKHQLDIEVERAQAQEARARRQFEKVDPENRLVARELERRWETTLTALQEATRARELKLKALPKPLTESEKNDLRRVLACLPDLWNASTTGNEQRKEIVRLLISHVQARKDPATRRLSFSLHWTTGHVTSGSVELPRVGEHSRTIPNETLERLRELSRGLSDGEIAEVLNREDCNRPSGLPWTAGSVQATRSFHAVARPREEDRDYLPWRQVRGLLRIEYDTFTALVAAGKLRATRATSKSPWRVPREDVEALAAERRQLSGRDEHD